GWGADAWSFTSTQDLDVTGRAAEPDRNRSASEAARQQPPGRRLHLHAQIRIDVAVGRSYFHRHAEPGCDPRLDVTTAALDARPAKAGAEPHVDVAARGLKVGEPGHGPDLDVAAGGAGADPAGGMADLDVAAHALERQGIGGLRHHDVAAGAAGFERTPGALDVDVAADGAQVGGGAEGAAEIAAGAAGGHRAARAVDADVAAGRLHRLGAQQILGADVAAGRAQPHREPLGHLDQQADLGAREVDVAAQEVEQP